MRAHRSEDPTVPMRGERGGHDTTRIVAPRRRRDDADTAADDPMLDPPTGWRVVVGDRARAGC